MRDPFLHRQANFPSRFPLLLVGLLFCGALLLPAPPASAEVLLKWDDPGVVWPSGSLGPHTFTLSNGVQATITVAKDSGTAGVFTGSTTDPFAPSSPLEDCAGCASNAFGSAHDLAVVFDPTPSTTYPQNHVVSPIIITMSFSEPLTNLKFEISDIDFSQAGSNPGSSHRLDEIVVTSDAGNPTLSFKTAGPHTFSIFGNRATSNCTGGQPTCSTADDTTQAPLDKGTVVVDFGAAAVTTVTVTYNETSNGLDPAARGIGVFGNLTPVELISFTVD